MFVVWGLVLQYGEELFLNFTVFFVVSGEGQYREELTLNLSVCCVAFGKGNIERNWF